MDFRAEFSKLVLAQPKNALVTRIAQDCAYSDYLHQCKKVYRSFFCTDAQDCYYSEQLVKAKDCVDCMYVTGSELCYECVDCSDLYNCSFTQDCHNGSNLDYCLDCMNCKNCFGCFGLRRREFCIFNKQYTEAEYRAKIAELKKHPPHKVLTILAPEFDKHPRAFARLLKGNERCYGDYIYFSKDCFRCFNVQNFQSAAYVEESMNREHPSSDSIDCTYSTGIELCYECDAVMNCTNCNFLTQCIGCSDSEYLFNCYNCRNCFCCTYLMNKEYCILNRQFTRDEYFAALKMIKNEMKAAGLYGKSLAEMVKTA